MNYEKLYHQLINSRLSVTKFKYAEYHHILPKCLGGSDDSSNRVYLTLCEHFLAHLLLYKFTTDPAAKGKMASGINRMIPKLERRTSKVYAYYRKLFIDSHPCKTNRIEHIAKIKAGNKRELIEKGYIQFLCNCGFTQLYKPRAKSIICPDCKTANHQADRLLKRQNSPICLCGCGKSTACKTDFWIKGHQTICSCGCGRTKTVGQTTFNQNQFIHGHNKNDPIIVSKRIKEFCNTLTKDELTARMLKSFGSGDQAQRAKGIREGKASSVVAIYPDGTSKQFLSCYAIESVGIDWPKIKRLAMKNIPDAKSKIKFKIIKAYTIRNRWKNTKPQSEILENSHLTTDKI